MTRLLRQFLAFAFDVDVDVDARAIGIQHNSGALVMMMLTIGHDRPRMFQLVQ